MKTVNVSELEGSALDYAVAIAIEASFEVKANYVEINHLVDRLDGSRSRVWEAFRPSTDWSQGGPLIEKHGVWLKQESNGEWTSSAAGGLDVTANAPLVAICRAIVIAKFDSHVEVPEELF